MATIYRFIVEQKISGDGGGRTPRSGKKSTGKGKWVSLFAGEKGGVEHNRKMRAINPLLNRVTGGWWEKGMRLSRAGLGIVKKNTETGKLQISGVSIAIIFAFLVQMLLKWQSNEQRKAEKLNAQNYKQLENGVGSIHGQYKVSQNIFTGRVKYNENK